MSTGFQIVYYSGNDKRKVRGHFDLRNVIQLRPSAEHAAGNGAVELDVAEEGQRKAKLMVISFRGDAAKERAEWLALWCSAVDPSCVSSALQAYADVDLDPFEGGTSQETIDAILAYGYYVDVIERHDVRAAGVKLDGPLVDLPGGQLRFALGAEARYEAFEQRGYYLSPVFNVDENMERDIGAVYGELFVPLFGDGDVTPVSHPAITRVLG